MKEVDGNVHVIPDGDLVEHEETHRCVCRPRWAAEWCEEHGVEWIFIHNSLDGRERGEESND